jgi:(p)ppGpp synthase/HD superfamily hydrolase
MLDRAIALAADAFKGRFDKAGKPYILHCLAVMNQMPPDDPELMSIAILHDVIEDTKYTLNDLEQQGFSRRIIQGVKCLTHDTSISYDDYIRIVATNPDAKKVKIADLRHNSDITRMKGLEAKDLERLEKYHRSYMYLTKVKL